MKYFLFAFLIFVTFISCRKDKVEEIIPVEEECPEERSFSEDVLPIISNNCSTTGCHDANSTNGYTFINYQQIQEHADIMLTAISGPNPTMPQNSDKLADSLIKTFDCWVKQGKLNN